MGGSNQLSFGEKDGGCTQARRELGDIYYVFTMYTTPPTITDPASLIKMAA